MMAEEYNRAEGRPSKKTTQTFSYDNYDKTAVDSDKRTNFHDFQNN